jgi:cytochrome c-type biogenesis protein CcmE
MTPRQQRMLFVGVIVGGVAIAATLAILAINEDIEFFRSPTQIKAGEYPSDRTIRAGGLVVEGSVNRILNDGLTVQFDISDTAEQITVQYTGILPDLFREGQGIIAIGSYKDNIFSAEEVLAKHDEEYMPPDVAEALKMAKEGGKVEMPASHKTR